MAQSCYFIFHNTLCIIGTAEVKEKCLSTQFANRRPTLCQKETGDRKDSARLSTVCPSFSAIAEFLPLVVKMNRENS